MDGQMLLSTLGLDEASAWESGPRLRRLPSNQELFHLISVEAVDQLVTSRGLRYPQFRLVANGVEIDRSRYTCVRHMRGYPVDGLAASNAVFSAWSEGAVLALQSVQDFWAPLGNVCRELTAIVGHPVRANCYLAPPRANGLSLHYDSHDNIVVQIDGRRAWDVYPALGDRPVPSEKPTFVHDRERYGNEVRKTTAIIAETLTPGDTLFIPAGCAHEVRTEEYPSLHLTFGIHRVQRRDIALRLATIASSSPEFRAAIPPRFSNDVFKEAIEEVVPLLIRRLHEIDAVATTIELAAPTLPALAGIGSGLLVGSFRKKCELASEIAGTNCS